jgi:sigma-B regulation protein RsbU (phosphoserine phosphatase)
VAADHLPTLLTRTGETHAAGAVFQAGAVVAPPETDGPGLGLILRALLSQAETLQQLKAELSITRRHHGGLRGEMNKLDEELRLAAQVQREFLPAELPRIGHVSVSVMFSPAGYVSGDIYDVFRLDEEHIGFWLADVAGHGVPAALMTMFVKRALPTKETAGHSYRLIPPDEAMVRLNREMVNRAAGNVRFATACYAVVNCRTQELQIARAGHPLPMLLKAGGGTVELDVDGPLLGVFDDAEFELHRRILEPGDRLLIYSDGFEGAFIGDDPADRRGYRKVFANLREPDPAEAVRELEAAVEREPGSLHQEDDLTVLMLDVAATVARPRPPAAAMAAGV